VKVETQLWMLRTVKSSPRIIFITKPFQFLPLFLGCWSCFRNWVQESRPKQVQFSIFKVSTIKFGKFWAKASKLLKATCDLRSRTHSQNSRQKKCPFVRQKGKNSVHFVQTEKSCWLRSWKSF
jgi:hypothetical protein